jgi:hypothetical protein
MSGTPVLFYVAASCGTFAVDQAMTWGDEREVETRSG